MNRHRAILACSLALVVGVAVGGGGCANGGSGTGGSGDDAGDDGATTGDVTVHEGGGADGGTCPTTGDKLCAGVCTDTGTDGKNCGACGHVCGMNQV